jgi:hypothetical protein
MRTKPFRATLPILIAAFTAARAFSANNELLVKWKTAPDNPAVARANAEIGAVVRQNFVAIGWQHVQLPSGMTLNEGLNAYRTLPDVVAVTPNQAFQPSPRRASADRTETDRVLSHSLALSPSLVPNDPRYTGQWNLKKIQAPAAWAVTTGSTNVVVAVVDGVSTTPPDLADNMWLTQARPESTRRKRQEPTDRRR